MFSIGPNMTPNDQYIFSSRLVELYQDLMKLPTQKKLKVANSTGIGQAFGQVWLLFPISFLFSLSSVLFSRSEILFILSCMCGRHFRSFVCYTLYVDCP
jgi:hypothetical protein